jgi:opacity protein-like surface antigen
MKKLLALLLAASCVSAAYAENVYVDANVGVNTSWSTLGLNADVGYMFNKYVGLEGGFTYSPGYNYNWGANGTWSSSYYMFDGAVKGVLPLSNLIDLYGKLGLAFNNYSNSWNGCNGYGCGGPAYSGSNVGLLVAGGVQFNLSRQWSVHVEDYTSTGPNPNFLMFGGQYNF